MNIALIGYGKMGRTIEALGLKRGHNFPLIVDVQNAEDLVEGKMAGIDAAIEFTTPVSAPGNILRCIELGIPVVSGTTGWNNRLSEIEVICGEKQGAFFYASNFSIGVNILFAMNRQLARIMDHFPAYSVSLKEVHHIHKLDAPSGTAITLAEQIISEQERMKGWSLEPHGEPGTIHIEAVREGEIKGRHIIRYASELDSISLSHEAFSRDAMAEGALMAAEFIRGRTGVFGMGDVLHI
jgi:4-hydroxy-tetrahydrodipicolinate reductase